MQLRQGSEKSILVVSIGNDFDGSLSVRHQSR
jgi:hypothetical protein